VTYFWRLASWSHDVSRLIFRILILVLELNVLDLILDL